MTKAAPGLRAGGGFVVGSLVGMRVPDPSEVTHAPYRREPYIRVVFPDGVRDGKAMAWTRDMVLFHAEPEGIVTDVWVPAHAVTRIPRQDSTWTDPYDLLR